MVSRPILLFDVMDTLVYNPFRREVPAFFGLTLETLLELKDATAWPRFELGSIDEAEYLRRYFRDRRRFDHTEFLRTMQDAYRWLEGMETLLADLNASGYEIHALSNYPLWFQTIDKKLQLSRYLDWTFVSCKTGVRKPSAEAYLLPPERLHRPPEDFLFVDDIWENCEQAQRVGMHAVHFTGLDDLIERLSEHGVQ
jgi:HAD superfamily hydrolase (TIGR01509 family)